MHRIAIHSVPRSGSSWLGQIFNSSPTVVYKYQPLFSYAFKGALSPHSSRGEILQFFEAIAARSDDFLDQTEAVRSGIYPQFEKSEPRTHIVYKEVRYHHLLDNLLSQDESLRVVGLVRNPLAVLASWKQAPKEFKPEWDFLAEWRGAPSKNQGRPEEFYGFDKWLEVAESFRALAARFPDQFRLIRYHELLTEPAATVQSLFDWCEIPWNSQTEEFLQTSRGEDRRDTYSVYNSKQSDDAWRNELADEIIREVRQVIDARSMVDFMESNWDFVQ